MEDRGSGAWVPWEPDEPREPSVAALCNADGRGFGYGRDRHGIETFMQQVYVTKRGDLEIWHTCDGCAPRKALHGMLCEQCHLKLAGWLSNSVGALSWGYGWIAGDLEPSQNAAPSGKISRGKPTPPAALALHVHVLRQDIAQHLGSWLAMLTELFNLVGPDWWSWREIHRQHPHNQVEVDDAAKYLSTWLDRIEGVSEYVTTMYDSADHLMRRVASLAPWEPRKQRMDRLQCPECERESLYLVEGDEHLTCRRCGALVSRAKYDRWAFLISAEKEEEKVG